MTDLTLADVLPGLPGDFQPLDYDDEDGDLCSPLGECIPFTNLSNLMEHPRHSVTKNKSCTNLKQRTKEKTLLDNSIKKRDPLMAETNKYTTGLEVNIDCREEVVMTKGSPRQALPDSTKFLSPKSKSCSKANVHIPPVTPTKPGEENLDPLTPTTNLKMLISVASPEIRNLEKRQQIERKERLFHAMLAVTSDEHLIHGTTVCDDPHSVTGSQDSFDQENVKETSRKAKSLGLLCERFLEKYQNFSGQNQEPQDISLDVIAKDLNVERRRIYDIINVLESVEMVSRKAKNRYVWHGQHNLMETLKKLKYLGSKYNYGDQLIKLKQLEKNKMVGETGECSCTPGNPQEGHPKQPLGDEEAKKEKSLGVMSQKFIMLFLQPKNKTISLETAARVLYGELSEDITDNPKFKTKVRRLYDIANILGSLKMIRKVYVQEVRGRKPAFEWIGPDPDIEGFEPENIQSLLTVCDKKTLVGEGNRKRSRRRGQKAGWGRHSSFNAITQVVETEPKAPRSLPSSPEKQPPTPITDAGDFQLELAALYSKYPGQMQQFLATPPAGSVASPATARKLLLPSPSQSCSQEIFPLSLPTSTNSITGVGSQHEAGFMLPGSDSSKTVFVQRFLPVLTPNTLLHVHAQSSPPCGTMTTAGNCPPPPVNIVMSCNSGLTTTDIPLGHTRSGVPLGNSGKLPSNVILADRTSMGKGTGALQNGNKRHAEIASSDGEYQAVMKQMKMVHQPGGLVPSTDSPSPPTIQLSPSAAEDGQIVEGQTPTEVPVAKETRTEKTNGWYDNIMTTPSGHVIKKTAQRKRHSKKGKPSTGKKQRSHLKKQARSFEEKQTEGDIGQLHVKRRLLSKGETLKPPTCSDESSNSSIECQSMTPPSRPEKDLSKQKRQLFRSHSKEKDPLTAKPRRPKPDSDSGRDTPNPSPSLWSQSDVSTPVSSLRSSFESQEFDQMLRNNVGSPLISFFPNHSQEPNASVISPCTLPDFISHAQPSHMTVLPSPTPLPPQTSISLSPVNLTLVSTSEAILPQVTRYCSQLTVTCPIPVISDGSKSLTDRQSQTLMLPSIAQSSKPAISLHATAFEVVPQS